MTATAWQRIQDTKTANKKKNRLNRTRTQNLSSGNGTNFALLMSRKRDTEQQTARQRRKPEQPNIIQIAIKEFQKRFGKQRKKFK